MIDLKKLKKGSYVVHENEPCIVKDIKFVVTGTHSHTKAKLMLESLFSGKSHVLSLPLHEQMQEADIIRKCATVVSKSKGKLQIMDVVNFETFDADISDELMEQAAEGNQVTYIQFENATKVLEVRK